jgi:hypothetical protein
MKSSSRSSFFLKKEELAARAAVEQAARRWACPSDENNAPAKSDSHCAARCNAAKHFVETN